MAIYWVGIESRTEVFDFSPHFTSAFVSEGRIVFRKAVDYILMVKRTVFLRGS